MAMFFIWGFAAVVIGWVIITYWRESTGRTRRYARNFRRDRGDAPGVDPLWVGPIIGSPSTEGCSSPSARAAAGEAEVTPQSMSEDGSAPSSSDSGGASDSGGGGGDSGGGGGGGSSD